MLVHKLRKRQILVIGVSRYTDRRLGYSLNGLKSQREDTRERSKVRSQKKSKGTESNRQIKASGFISD